MIKVLYMRCLILKLQGPKLEKCRSYHTKRYINYNDALRPNILVVWGALCGWLTMSQFMLKEVVKFYFYNKRFVLYTRNISESVYPCHKESIFFHY